VLVGLELVDLLPQALDGVGEQSHLVEQKRHCAARQVLLRVRARRSAADARWPEPKVLHRWRLAAVALLLLLLLLRVGVLKRLGKL
jgi:hypothetical protein